MTNDTKLVIDHTAAIQFLETELAKNPLSSNSYKIDYLQYAARLAALGDKRLLELFFMEEDCDNSFNEAMIARCERGIDDLQNSFGEDLAHAILDCQDFYILTKIWDVGYADAILKWKEVCDKIDLEKEPDDPDDWRGYLECWDYLADFDWAFDLPREYVFHPREKYPTKIPFAEVT
jgi:hypothetical protein